MGDFSKKTVLVLLILTIVLSASTTLMTLSNMKDKSVDLAGNLANPDASGKVTVQILEQPAPMSTTGKVSLTIRG